MKIPALTLLAVAALLAWTTGATAHDKLGEVHWPISCTPAAQVEFDRALAMLHAFWLPQATRAFEKVAAADPGCAMAQWGIAMGQRGNPLVGAPAPAASEAGWAAVQRARALGAQTPRERDAIAALETYFKDWPSVEHGRRVLDYERAMEQLALRYPSDPEVTTLYALALNEAITVLPADKTYARHLRRPRSSRKSWPSTPIIPGRCTT